MIIGTLLYRTAPGERCTISAMPGLSIRVDGYDTGAQTRPGGISLRLPFGRHRIRLAGPGAPVGEQSLDVAGGATCVAHFEGTPRD